MDIFGYACNVRTFAYWEPDRKDGSDFDHKLKYRDFVKVSFSKIKVCYFQCFDLKKEEKNVVFIY